MNEELEKIAQDMRRKERELWAGNPPRMGNGAAIHTALDSVRIEMLKRLAGIQPQISDMGILELCVDAQHNITPGEAAMADAVGKAVKSIDPHTLPPFHEEYAIKTTQGYVWRGDSEEDFELLKTLDGARKIVDRLESYNLMQGFWEHPKHTIVRRVVGEWEDA